MKIIAQNINLNSRYIPQKEAKVHSYYDLRANTPVNKSNVSQLNFKSLLQKFTKPQVLTRKAAISKIKSYLTVCKDTIKVEDYLDVFKTKGGYDLEKIKKLSFLNKVGKDKHLISQLFYAVIFRTKSFYEASDAVNLLLDSGYYVYETIKILDIASRENDDKFRYPELPKLAADLKATHPEAACEIIDTATEDHENHFNRKAFDKILELEKIFPSVDAVDIIYNCHNEDNVFIDGCLNEINNLINLGFDADQITGILETATDNYKHSYTAEGFKLTENLPEWVKKDKKLIKKFIISRIVSTDNVFSEFSVKNYKIFNNFANFVNIDNHEKDLGLCETLTAFFENEKLDKHYIQTLEVAKRINLKQALQFAWLDSAGECQMAMKLMDANLKKPIDVVSILYDSDSPDSNLKKVHKYLELYNFANEQNFEISSDEYVLAHLINHCYNQGKFCPTIFNYIKNNLNKKDLLLFIKHGRTKAEQNIHPEKIAIAQSLHKREISLDALEQIMNSKFWSDKNLLKDLDKVNEYFPNIGTNILLTCYQNNYSLDELVNLRKDLFEIAKNADVFEDDLATNTDIADFLENDIFKNVEALFKTMKILGKDNFLKLAKEKFDDLDSIVDLTLFPFKVDWKTLIDMLHPEDTAKFKEIEQKIVELKKSFKLNDDNTEIINKIKELSAEKNKMLDKKLTDPKEIYARAFLYRTLSLSYSECLKEVLPYIASNKESDREEFKKILNKYIFKILNIEIEKDEIKNIFDFSRSKYIDRLPVAEGDFTDGIRSLVEVLENNYSSNISETLNNLPHNIATKKEFDNLSIDYDKWVSPLENITLKCNTIPNIHKKLHNTLENLHKEFNSSGFYNIPQKERQALEEAMQKRGFSFQDSQKRIYDEDGFYSGEVNIIKIAKNFLPLDIDAAKEFIDFFNEYTKNSSFWNIKNENKTIEEARTTLLDHILKRRSNEVENVLKRSKNPKFKELIIQKVDMDDVIKSLFLGDDAGCCTASDGCNSWSAVAYILNKCIQAIEFKSGDTSFGNTMCFIAKVNDKPALILDNIEIKSEYQYSDVLRDAIIDFSQKLCSEIGRPDMAVYAGANRHFIDFSNYPVIQDCSIKHIGTTDDYVYIDAFDEEAMFETDGYRRCPLIKIKD